jgi:hypothetical protein
MPGMRSGRVLRHGRHTVRRPHRSPHFSMAIISVTVILLMSYIGIVQHKELPPEVVTLTRGTACVYIHKYIHTVFFMFRGTVSFTQENHNFIVQIGKNKCSQ